MLYVKEVAQGSTISGSPGSLVLTLKAGISVPIGHTIMLAAGGGSGVSRSVSTIVDSQSNTWELARNDASATFPQCMARCRVTTALNAGDTITITWTGTLNTVLAIAEEFSNINNSNVDKSASATGASTTPTSPTTSTTTSANELLFAATMIVTGSVAPTDDYTPDVVSPVWNELPGALTVGSSTVHRAIIPMYRIVSSTGTYAATGTMTASHNWRASIVTYAGGTVDSTAYTSSLSGSLASSGVVQKATTRSLTGTVTSAGAAIRGLARSLSGTLTCTGAVLKETARSLAGSLTSAGSLTRDAGRALAGTLASSGTVTRATTRTLVGSLASAGSLARAVSRALSGSLSSAGSLTTRSDILRTLTGTLTSAGTLTRDTARTLTGTLTSAGGVLRGIARLLGGILSSAGLVHHEVPATPVLLLARGRSLTTTPRGGRDVTLSARGRDTTVEGGG